MVREETEVDLMFKKPYRVETWFERDRKSIVVYDANDREIAEWWDDDVDEMVESGYFDASGFIMGREIHPHKLEDSVLGYIEKMKLDKPARLPYAKEMMTKALRKWPKKNPPRWTFTEDERLRGIQQLRSLQDVYKPLVIMKRTDISPVMQMHLIEGGAPYSGMLEKIEKLYREAFEKKLFRNPGDVHLDIDIGSHNAAKGARTNVNPPALMVGDIVKYSRAFLQSTGMYTGSVPHASGKIINLSGTKDFILATIEWNDPDLPKRVNVKNLVLKARLHLEPNPPLPASALMDISTAKTVVREVEAGDRTIHPALSQADTLLDRGLQKLRGSHLGNVDWSNPPDALSATERILLSAFKAQGRLSMRDIPGHYSEGVATLVGRNLIRPVPGMKWTWELTPAGRKEKENPPAVEVYRNIVEIRAEKKNGERFVHKFSRGSSIYGLPNGNILIASRSGKKLWKNFKTEG
jgi:hypothetical protein